MPSRKQKKTLRIRRSNGEPDALNPEGQLSELGVDLHVIERYAPCELTTRQMATMLHVEPEVYARVKDHPAVQQALSRGKGRVTFPPQSDPVSILEMDRRRA